MQRARVGGATVIDSARSVTHTARLCDDARSSDGRRAGSRRGGETERGAAARLLHRRRCFRLQAFLSSPPPFARSSPARASENATHSPMRSFLLLATSSRTPRRPAARSAAGSPSSSQDPLNEEDRQNLADRRRGGDEPLAPGQRDDGAPRPRRQARPAGLRRVRREGKPGQCRRRLRPRAHHRRAARDGRQREAAARARRRQEHREQVGPEGGRRGAPRRQRRLRPRRHRGCARPPPANARNSV